MFKKTAQLARDGFPYQVSYGCSNPVYGTTKNPHRLDRTPGGSSGGEVRYLEVHQIPRELFWLLVDPSLVLEAIWVVASESRLT